MTNAIFRVIPIPIGILKPTCMQTPTTTLGKVIIAIIILNKTINVSVSNLIYSASVELVNIMNYGGNMTIFLQNYLA